MLDPPPFKTGDTVRLKSGRKPIRVLEVDYFHCSSPESSPPKIKKWTRPRKGWYIQFMYASEMSYRYNNEREYRTWREADDFVFYNPEGETTMTQQQLYQTKEEKPRFGTFLTRTSTGKIALEMKGGGEVETFDKTEIEEVTPHTVCIKRFQGGENSNGEERHYEMKPDSVAVDDVLVHLSTGALYKVIKVDTKQKSARKSKKGFFKLQGSFVTTDN